MQYLSIRGLGPALVLGVGFTLGLAPGCKAQQARSPGEDPSGPGFVDTSSLDLKTGAPPSLDVADQEGITKRGVELYYMEVGMQLAYERGLPRAGRYDAAALLPLAMVDEGHHSGQVEFYRWRKSDVGDTGSLEAAKAHRWLVVPFLLRPNRVLENEQFSDLLDEKSDDFWKVDAIIRGAMAAREGHPGGTWHVHAFRESRRDGTRRIRSTRLYMFGLDGGAPDLEVVVQDPLKKRESASVVELVVVHEPADYAGEIVRSRQQNPGPLTVARVRARGLEAGDVPVETSDGSQWRISAETGVIELATETPSG